MRSRALLAAVMAAVTLSGTVHAQKNENPAIAPSIADGINGIHDAGGNKATNRTYNAIHHSKWGKQKSRRRNIRQVPQLTRSKKFKR